MGENESGGATRVEMGTESGLHATLTEESSKIWLTWHNLSVTTLSEVPRARPLLHEGSGMAPPGHVVALMGPSGSGKTTLLDALAGRLSANLKKSGSILVNGKKLMFSSAYVTQDDVLLSTLTVREAVQYSAQLQLPSYMCLEDKKERADATIKEMGLTESASSRIGGWNGKGLSGGERRRVSIAMELITQPQLLFLDEPTSGLDSEGTYHVMRRLNHLSRGGRTIVASIHQPSSDVFELFTYLCLLSVGRTVFFGTTSQALQFFAKNGFPCPSMKCPSDHYLRLINSDFERDKEEGEGDKLHIEKVVDSLVVAYNKSETALEIQQKIQEICNEEKGKPIRAMTVRKKKPEFFSAVWVLVSRSQKNMHRDIGYYWFRLGIYLGLGFGVGTVFFKLGHNYNSIQARGSMLFFIYGFMTFMAMGSFPSFVEEMRLFERERLNGHYGVGAFVMANFLASLPFVMIISMVPVAIPYVLAQLQIGFLNFLYFELAIFSCMLIVEGLMLAVACLLPNYLMGLMAGAGVQGIFMLAGGYVRLPNDLPKIFWRFPTSYMSFHYYANQGIFINEYKGLQFQNIKEKTRTLTGEYVLENMFQIDTQNSKWSYILILFFMALIYRFLFFIILKTRKKVRYNIPIWLHSYISKVHDNKNII